MPKIEKRNSVRLIAFGMALISATGISGILPVLPDVAVALGMPAEASGAIIAAYAIPGFFVIPVWGVIADRYGRKSVLIPSLLFFLLGGMGCSLAVNYHSLLFFRVVQGVGGAPLGLLYATIIADTWTGKDRARVMGQTGMVLGISTGACPALGGLLGLWHWRYVFWVCLVVLPVLVLVLKTPLLRPQQNVSLRGYLRAGKANLKVPGTRSLLYLTFCSFIVLGGPIVICFPLIGAEGYKASSLFLGIIMSVAALSSAVPAAKLAALHSRFSPRILLSAAQYGYLICIFLLFLAWQGKAFLPGSLLVIPIIFYGLGQGITVPLTSVLLSGQASDEHRASLMAMNAMSMKLSQGCTSLLFSGLTLAIGVPTTTLLAVIPVLTVLVMLRRVYVPDIEGFEKA